MKLLFDQYWSFYFTMKGESQIHMQVAIPILMARILTYPERVSQHNIEKLRQCVRNGPNKYPGAKFIKHPDGTEMYEVLIFLTPSCKTHP